MAVMGRIHSVETFGTVDGPGIRYVVFAQGCNLKCKFCHNRDTWEMNAGKLVSSDEIIEDMLKYKSFYKDGGITMSGGEAALQVDFVRDIFKQAKKHEVHTCLDTNGYLDVERIKPILEYTDLVLLDLKHMIPENSIWLTGAPSEKAQILARYLDDVNIPVYIRHVLIPDITDSEENLTRMVNFVKTLHNVVRFEFLPYHIMGVSKWEQMNKEYELKYIRPATQEDVDKAKALFIKNGYDHFEK
ncbi:pyruvate formate-lyase-activating protein [Peptostreptococcus equinus]|uniref:Pyruvate formate-lyase-activating enzyme n=1 Tax=Peptostreptococcus equinus TaxID=3003601 RepID=A0ABY7JQU1_9FIRM|nr:pyruvate formate-lyase-activating protein [Peptostreptococcus sp. CBA3647]WAW14340.1 pyruvate formate-lyase-activating protein [Peptostreptococcus sp. CBA3647]